MQPARLLRVLILSARRTTLSLPHVMLNQVCCLQLKPLPLHTAQKRSSYSCGPTRPLLHNTRNKPRARCCSNRHCSPQANLASSRAECSSLRSLVEQVRCPLCAVDAARALLNCGFLSCAVARSSAVRRRSDEHPSQVSSPPIVSSTRRISRHFSRAKRLHHPHPPKSSPSL